MLSGPGGGCWTKIKRPPCNGTVPQLKHLVTGKAVNHLMAACDYDGVCIRIARRRITSLYTPDHIRLCDWGIRDSFPVTSAKGFPSRPRGAGSARPESNHSNPPPRPTGGTPSQRGCLVGFAGGSDGLLASFISHHLSTHRRDDCIVDEFEDGDGNSESNALRTRRRHH